MINEDNPLRDKLYARFDELEEKFNEKLEPLRSWILFELVLSIIAAIYCVHHTLNIMHIDDLGGAPVSNDLFFMLAATTVVLVVRVYLLWGSLSGLNINRY